MDERIRPALNINTDGRSELSPQEFQRQLYSYFEDRGLLAELRAHLRVQMINILKSAGIGKNSATKQGISPKLQALNMLIAEFFLHQEYHYSLCVFTTEVPLVNIFVDVPDCIMKKTSAEMSPTKWRFNEKDMWDLLETLGIAQNTEEGSHMKKLYYENADESLLTGLIRMLNKMKLIKKDVQKVPENENLNTSIDVIKGDSFAVIYDNVAQLLAKFHITTDNINQILDLIRFIVNEEKKLVENTYKKELNSYKQKMEAEILLKDKEYQKREKEIERLYHGEKKILEDELKKTQLNMRSCAESLQKRFEEYQVKCEMLKKRELEMQAKEQEYIAVKNILQKDLEDVYKEKMTLRDLKNEYNLKMREDFNDKDKQNNVRKPTVDETQQTANDLDIENALLKQTIKQMETENSNLRSQNTDCQNRVRELAEHAKKIKHDLQAYENKYSFFKKYACNNIPAQQRTRNMVNTGNGEEVVSYPPSATIDDRQLKEFTRKAKHRRYNHQSSSDEPSYTEEILQETKQRLKNLERESENIDRNLKDYYCKKRTEFNTGQSKSKTSNEILKDFAVPTNISNANFHFFNDPTTSAANLFHYEFDRTVNEEVNNDHKNTQKVTNPRRRNSNRVNASSPEICDKSIKAATVQQEDHYPTSGQSVNSSGVLNELIGTMSLSNVEISSDKESE